MCWSYLVPDLNQQTKKFATTEEMWTLKEICNKIYEQVTIEEEIWRGNKYVKLFDFIKNLWKPNETMKFCFKPDENSTLLRYRKSSVGEKTGKKESHTMLVRV